MKTNPTMNHPIHQLSALICVICGLTFLPLTVFAANYDAPTGVTTSQTSVSYNDSDPTKSALNVSGEGTTYNGTNITLSTTTAGGFSDAIGNGAYVDDGAILSLTGGTITTAGRNGYGFFLLNSSGTVSGVNIKTEADDGRGALVTNSTLLLTGGTIHTSGTYAYGVYATGSSTGTLNNVNIETTGYGGRAVYATNSTLTLTGGSITTTGVGGNGVLLSSTSTGTLNGVNIKVEGQQAFGINVIGTSTATVILDGNTVSSTGAYAGSIAVGGSSTMTLTGSNGSVITGTVSSRTGSTIGITLDGAGTELHGNFFQDATSTINLTLGAGALLRGSGTLDSLTLANGAVIGYTGLITVTDSIEIDGTVTFDLSNLTATGEYNLLNWSGATVTGDITDLQFTNETAGVEGTFSVANNQLVFNATAVPEPSIWFLMGAGLGLLLLTAHYRRRKAQS